MVWWDDRRPVRSAEESRSQFVRSKASKEDVYVLPVLSSVESEAMAAVVLAAASLHGWCSKHDAYPTRDLPAERLPPHAHAQLLTTLSERLLSPLAARAGFSAAHLYCRDLFFVIYTPDAQAGLELHRDGSLLSFNLLLSSPAAFAGGGTTFHSLTAAVAASLVGRLDADGVTVTPQRGEAVVHPGGLLHGGRAVSSGTRLLLVGFVESVRPGR